MEVGSPYMASAPGTFPKIYYCHHHPKLFSSSFSFFSLSSSTGVRLHVYQELVKGRVQRYKKCGLLPNLPLNYDNNQMFCISSSFLLDFVLHIVDLDILLFVSSAICTMHKNKSGVLIMQCFM